MNDLILGALNLTVFGMGFVFLFLTVLVFITKFMSYIVNSKFAQTKETPSTTDNTLLTQNDVDEEAKFVIQQAIKMHTGA